MFDCDFVKQICREVPQLSSQEGVALECPIAVSELNVASIAVKMRICNNRHGDEYAENEVCAGLQTFYVLLDYPWYCAVAVCL